MERKDRKRSLDEEREHLLKKIRKLEKKISALPDSDGEDNRNKNEQSQKTDSTENAKENVPPEVPEQDEEKLFEQFLNEEGEEGELEQELDEEILDILGVIPNEKPVKESLRAEIAGKWAEILEKGLKKEEITKKNPPFTNCPKMVVPKLNKEVSAALNENAKRRNMLIELRQKQVSTSLSCIGQAMQLCLAENIQDKKLNIFKKLNESARLLCDALYLDTRGRRTLVLSTINKSLKETEPEEYLFGENLAEKIRSAKAVQKSGKDLKSSFSEEKKKKKPETNNKETERRKTLNWRGPPRSLQIKKTRGAAPKRDDKYVKTRK